jgi:hypothetical protein
MTAKDDHTPVLENDEIVWRGEAEDLRIPLSDVRIVGEVTNQNGPWREDWFLCLVVRDDGTWVEVGMSTGGTDLYEQLASRLGISEPFRLTRSTDFESCVVWPPEIDGSPMFAFSAPEPGTATGRLLLRLGAAPSGNVQTLSREVLALVRS